MSYRSIKRVLGETSLERKCRFLFGACLLLLITGSFWCYGDQTEEIVNEQNRKTGHLLVDQDMQVRHWQRRGPKREIPATDGTTHGVVQQAPNARYNFILPNLPVAKDAEPDAFNPTDDFELQTVQRFLEEGRAKSKAANDAE